MKKIDTYFFNFMQGQGFCISNRNFKISVIMRFQCESLKEALSKRPRNQKSVPKFKIVISMRIAQKRFFQMGLELKKMSRNFIFKKNILFIFKTRAKCSFQCDSNASRARSAIACQTTTLSCCVSMRYNANRPKKLYQMGLDIK